MLTTTLPATPGDGTPEFVLELARNMDADVTILAPKAKGCPARTQIDGVSIIRFRYGPRFAESVADDAILPAIRQSPILALQVPGLVTGMAVAAWRAKRQIDPDLIHAHWLIPAGVIGAVLTYRNRCELLVTAHGADAFAMNDALSATVKRFVLRRSDKVHAVSSDIAGVLHALSPRQSIEALPIGVDVESVAAATANRSPNGRLLFVGRLAEKKGVDVLLSALALLRDEHGVIVPTDIVGDGPLRDSLETGSKQLGLDSQVVFHGSKSRSDVLECYRQAELIALPSKTAANGDRDGTPVVLMEAIAARVPVVATSVGGIADLLEDRETAWLAQEDDPQQFANALSEALTHPDRAGVAEQCLSSTVERIDVGRIGAALLRQAA